MLLRMLRMALFAGLLLTLLEMPRGAAASSSPRPPALAWVFDIHEDREGTPQGQVFLRVNGKKVLVLPKTQLSYSLLPRAEYRLKKIPAAALTACSGWWAGAGEDLYVVAHGGRLNVFLRDLDEQAPDTPYRRIKSIPLPQRPRAVK